MMGATLDVRMIAARLIGSTAGWGGAAVMGTWGTRSMPQPLWSVAQLSVVTEWAMRQNFEGAKWPLPTPWGVFCRGTGTAVAGGGPA